VHLEFSDTDVVMTRRRLSIAMVLIIAAVIVANLLANKLIIMKKLETPIKAMIVGIDAVAAGKYDTTLPMTGFTDVDPMVALINDMANKVRIKNSELTALNESLEHRVEARTAELKESLENLNLAQDRLIESSRLAALGHLSAGIAHELNTPLGAIISSTTGLIDYLDGEMKDGLGFAQSLDAEQAALYTTVVAMSAPGFSDLEAVVGETKKVAALRARIVAAGVKEADAITEYLVELGIADRFPELAESLRLEGATKVLAEASEDVAARRMAEVIRISARKATIVVTALRSYLNPEGKNQQENINVDEELEKVLVLLNSVMKHGVAVTRDFSGARATGSADLLSQVWMHLIRNAIQAMEYRGTLSLRTETRDGTISISIVDSGPGIPEEIQDRIFAPFFSTKKSGEGMGLGLHICRRIVEKHQGQITVESRPGRTEFTVLLPAVGNAPPEELLS